VTLGRTSAGSARQAATKPSRTAVPIARCRPVSGSNSATVRGAPEGSIAGAGAGANRLLGRWRSGRRLIRQRHRRGGLLRARLSCRGDIGAQLRDLRRILAARATRNPVDHPLGVLRGTCGQVLTRRKQRNIDVPAKEPLRGSFIEPRGFRMPSACRMRFGSRQVVAARSVRHRDRRARADRHREGDGGQDGGCLPAANACVQHEGMSPVTGEGSDGF
jgi:hypothetical protein